MSVDQKSISAASDESRADACELRPHLLSSRAFCVFLQAVGSLRREVGEWTLRAQRLERDHRCFEWHMGAVGCNALAQLKNSKLGEKLVGDEHLGSITRSTNDHNLNRNLPPQGAQGAHRPWAFNLVRKGQTRQFSVRPKFSAKGSPWTREQQVRRLA